MTILVCLPYIDVSSVVVFFHSPLFPNPTHLSSFFLLLLFFKTWVGGLKMLQEQFVTRIFEGESAVANIYSNECFCECVGADS